MFNPNIVMKSSYKWKTSHPVASCIYVEKVDGFSINGHDYGWLMVYVYVFYGCSRLMFQGVWVNVITCTAEVLHVCHTKCIKSS